MDLKLIVAGLAMGLAIAAPLGPVNIIVIRSTLRRGMIGGLAAGFGSVLADTSFAVVAAYGLRSIASFFMEHGTALNLIGGALLVVIGVRTARSHVAMTVLTSNGEAATAAQLWRKGATTFSTTITNPGALLGVFAVFGAMGNVLKLESAPYRPLVAVAAFAAGGLLWWLFLSFIVGRLKTRLTTGALDRINRWAGVLIAAFGFALLMQVFA